MHYNSFKSRYLRVMLLSLVFLLTAGQLSAKTVYFLNTIPYNSPWEQPYVHYFGGQDQTSWPGKAMTHVEGDWWKCDIGNNNGVVFNNGGNGQQTHDLTVNNDTETAFICSHWDGEKLQGNWTTYTPTVWTIVGHSAIVNGGEWNLSNTDNDMVKGDDGTYSLTIENKTINAGNYEYKVAKNHSWDGAFPVSGNYTLNIPESGEYTIVYTFNGTSNLTATATKKVVPVVIHTVKISGGLNINGNWTTTDKLLENNEGIFTYTFTATEGINKYFRVKVDDKFIGGNTTSLQLNDPVEYYENAAENFEFHISSTENLVNGSEYTLVINTNDNTISINGTGGHTANEIPVYPHGVQSETELAAYDFASNPVVYLMSNVLNNNRVTPEWQMISDGNGNYHLNGFAARTASDYKVRVYTSATSYVESASVSIDCNDGNASLAEGKLYNASVALNEGNYVLTLTEDESANGRMPFISLVGYAMQQDQVYQTPRAFEGHPSDVTTAKGWQEAWLLHDENGKLVKDRQEHVIYNTMWPPKNPVYFTANIGGERLYSSEQMTFKAQNNYEAKTGAEWKAELLAGENGEAYANLGTGDYALEDGVNYVRYVVPDIWYVGSAKVWTGWNGEAYNNNGWKAMWSHHANWGYENKRATDEDGTDVVAEQPYYLSTDDNYNGNFKFDNPTYFKTIEFFYNTANRNESRLYTTLAFGKAQIEAQSHKQGDTYDRGQYKPTVTPDQGVSVESYIIRCYDAATGKIVALNDGIVAQGEGSPNSLTFVNDAIGLAEGKYYYEMEVVFQTANGTRTATVKSNPFIIHFPGVYTLEPVAQQLAQMGTNPNGYVSYSTSNEAIYHVTLNAAGEIESIAPVAEGERADLYKNNFDKNTGINWSDKVLVVAPVPAQFKLDAEKAEPAVSLETISTYDVTDNGTHKVVAKRNDGSLAYVANTANFDSKAFNAVMNYQDITTSVDKTTEGKAVTVEMMRPNPLAGGEATVTVEKIENSENIVVDDIEVAADYYKVCVELPFADANVTNASDQPAYQVTVDGVSKLYTATTGDKAITIAAVNPTQASDVKVSTLYKNASGQYTLAANIGDELSLTAGDAMFTPGKRKIDMFEIAKVKVKPLNSDDPLYYDNYITKLGVVDEEYDKLPGRRLEPKYYKFKVTLNDDVVPFDQYFNKVFYNVQDITNFDVNNDAMYVSRTPRTQEISSASISISPVYPVLVNATVGAKGMEVTNGVASAPALKAETATYVALFGAAAEKEYTLNGGIVTGIDGVDASKAVQSVRFVNIAGQMSDKPFEGMNIVVTTYTDGTTATAKVIK